MKDLLAKLNLTYMMLSILVMIFSGFLTLSIFLHGLKRDIDSLDKSVTRIEERMDSDYYVSRDQYMRENDYVWLKLKDHDDNINELRKKK